MKNKHFQSILLFMFLTMGCISLSGCGGKEGATVIPPAHETTPTISFLYDHATGLEVARQTKKPAMIFFSVPDNAGSMRMMETTFGDDEIKRLAERLVCIFVDGSQESALCESLEISSFPTTVLLNTNGTEVRRLVGRQTPDQLAVQIHILLQMMAQRPLTTTTL
jgi:predicted small lipoprotein YifL